MNERHGGQQPKRLEKRPEATTFQLDMLLAKVLEGQVRVPRFQRGLRWEDEDRLQLFDSIYRGYPIGTLLLWKRPGPEATVPLGALTVHAPKRSDVLWIVDGQQRVTTLAEALLRTPEPDERSIHVDLDNEDEPFSYLRPSKLRNREAPRDPRYMPISTALDSAHLLDWLIEHGVNRDRRNRAIEIGKRIREYHVPAYIVETEDDRVPITIFDRTNRTGRRLTDPEVFEALFGSMIEGPPAGLEDIARILDSTGFGRLGRDDVLDALRAIEGLPFHEDFTRRIDPERVPDALRATERAMRRTVAFLQHDASIPHRELLPYSLPLTILSRFFHSFPEPRIRSRTLLRRWVWRGSLAMQLTGATVGIRQHLECIRDGDEEGSVQRLLGLVSPQPNPDVLNIADFNRQVAKSRLQCCALASLRPRDLRTGGTIDLSTLLSTPEKAFPMLVARRKGAPPDVSGLANRLLHPHLSPGELRDLLRDIEDEALLATHAITTQTRIALVVGKHDEFLSRRHQSLRELIEQFFRQKADPGADDTPSVVSMLEDD
ncbi:DUF262 domain-containing protein [Polyangium jinanense]|uniref:DUF262 domain-containing protein n=1 Tax=Polyangium jinanense TaxID=2829994 RepID=A0A9X3X1H3_9BACT|nr:DUF262 domain-containing protein [Polyangium jinanense]MDC3954040.1 DUF262 domain-containing protein [Polyangium jinanense]MDC3982004.1 DUF262 domain-containing protein [Polyangium jinanense]